MSLIPSLLVIFTMVSFLSGQQQEKPWQEFASKEGNFGVLAPSNIKKEESVISGGVEINSYSGSQDNTAYIVGYNLFSAGLLQQFSVEQTLNSVVKGMLIQANGKIISSLDIKLQDYPGKEFKIEGASFFFNAQIFLVKQRVYYLLIVSQKDSSNTKESKAFFDSFRLLSAPTDEKPPEQVLALNKFSSQAGNFSIEIVGNPQFFTLPLDIDGTKLNFHSFISITNNEIYTVAYSDLPANSIEEANADIIFNSIRDSTAIRESSKLIKESKIMLKNHPGRFFSFKKNTGPIILIKVYLVNHRLYLFSLNVIGQETNPEFVDKFLNSIQLLGADFDDPFDDGETTVERTTKPDTSNNPKAIKSENILKIDESELRSNSVERPVPEYPKDAVAQKLEGEVIVKIIVDKDGTVARTKVISGAGIFHEETVKAAKAWHFKPTLLNGEPMRVVGELTFRFKLP